MSTIQSELPLDFFWSFNQERKPGRGEDSFCYSFGRTVGMVGVFDGCGGSGAKRHDAYGGHAEAFVASRACAQAFGRLCLSRFPDTTPLTGARLTEEAVKCLRAVYASDDSGVSIKGMRSLPTTAAMALIQPYRAESALVTAIWAGDSRVYILDGRGLAQLSEDDSTEPDPMRTLYDDGILTNILCLDRPGTLHCSRFAVRYPFAVFSATDGCFGYLSTPMEFEGILLETLRSAAAPAEWEEKLKKRIEAVAGDDYTMCLAAYGFGLYGGPAFPAMKQIGCRRLNAIGWDYLDAVNALPIEDRAGRMTLWDSYKGNYLRYIEGT